MNTYRVISNFESKYLAKKHRIYPIGSTIQCDAEYAKHLAKMGCIDGNAILDEKALPAPQKNAGDSV